ncbi:MAG: HAD family phosphatase [Candidatus Micrarchaeia archaeon]|jgi:HAD superfamily hydrolase (TIGR01509 family)
MVGSVHAVIFDFDGVISRTEPLHYRSFNETVSKLGIHLPRKRWLSFTGRGAHYIMETVFRENGINEDIDEWVFRRRKLFLHYALTKPLFAVRGLRQFLPKLHKMNIYTGIASGSKREVVVPILNRLGLRNEFCAIIGSEDFRNKKPHPEAFLTAAEALGIRPENCLVFEDSESGIKAAILAGMRTYCVATAANAKELGLKYNVPLIKDYTKFPISVLL